LKFSKSLTWGQTGVKLLLKVAVLVEKFLVVEVVARQQVCHQHLEQALQVAAEKKFRLVERSQLVVKLLLQVVQLHNK
jgi:hypothetical protein